MARPRKCRAVCHFPRTLSFLPAGETGETVPVTLCVDEYEVIRLIDLEGLSQEQCGEKMQIARTTVQQIYASARKKLARMLVDGLPLHIEGGDYRLCNGTSAGCDCKDCYTQQINAKYASQKGEHTMRIAVTYENGEIFQHFGHTEQFKLYDVEDGAIVSSEVVGTNGQGHGALADVLHALKADILICGGIGGGAQAALAAAGIRLYGGASGDADEAVRAFLADELAYDPNVKCNHHGEHHHEGSCSSHGCGEHHCGN